MRALVERLFQARLTAASLEAETAQARRAFDEANAGLFQRREAARLELNEATGALRHAGLRAFQETGDLAPGPGLKVRMMKRMEYDEDEALGWALTHKMAVSLDRVAFEKLARATPLDFVRVYEEPQVTIATDLGPVLDEVTHAHS